MDTRVDSSAGRFRPYFSAVVVDGTEQDGVAATIGGDHVATVELRRPPNNFFDVAMIRRIADLYEALAAERDVRVIVLRASGKHFCAGADFSAGSGAIGGPGELYREAVRLFAAELPVVAAVQGAAIGGGLGLACSSDFRVATPQARFAANFARLGFHHGFALTATLPAIVGQQRALDLLYTGRRIDGTEAHRIGLADRIADPDELGATAHAIARDIAASAPLAVRSIRATMREPLLAAVRQAVEREAAEQQRLQHTADWREGVRASLERREPDFAGS
jgi:2-(1,2-epoxy-1,2-dihydrophenyl)acetyl-CoA isomerase